MATIGERSGPRKPWADTVDSDDAFEPGPSLVERTPSDLGLVRTDSYLTERVPSFDDPNGSTLRRLANATALEDSTSTNADVSGDMESSRRPLQQQRSAARQRSRSSRANRAAATGQSNAVVEAAQANRIQHNNENVEPSAQRNAASSADARPKPRPLNRHSAAVEEEDPRRRFSENRDDELWANRSRKRLKAVCGVKAASDYQQVSRLRLEGRVDDDNAPKTPDGTDRQLSKRMFEDRMATWKKELKQLNEAFGNNTEAVAAAPDAT